MIELNCENITITRSGDTGIQIELAEKRIEQEYHGYLLNSERYFLLQRSFPEEENEIDFYFVECSETKEELGFRDKIIFDFSKPKLSIQWSWVTLNVQLNVEKLEIEKLKRSLKRWFKEKVIILT